MAAEHRNSSQIFPAKVEPRLSYIVCVFFIVIYIYKSANAVKKLQIIFCNPLTKIALFCVSIHSVPSNILSPFTVTQQLLLPDEIIVGKKRHYNCLCH